MQIEVKGKTFFDTQHEAMNYVKPTYTVKISFKSQLTWGNNIPGQQVRTLKNKDYLDVTKITFEGGDLILEFKDESIFACAANQWTFLNATVNS